MTDRGITLVAHKRGASDYRPYVVRLVQHALRDTQVAPCFVLYRATARGVCDAGDEPHVALYYISDMLCITEMQE